MEGVDRPRLKVSEFGFLFLYLKLTILLNFSDLIEVETQVSQSVDVAPVQTPKTQENLLTPLEEQPTPTLRFPPLGRLVRTGGAP